MTEGTNADTTGVTQVATKQLHVWTVVGGQEELHEYPLSEAEFDSFWGQYTHNPTGRVVFRTFDGVVVGLNAGTIAYAEGGDPSAFVVPEELYDGEKVIPFVSRG